MSNNHHFGIGGKGYYIALLLCAGAIGITGYLYRKNAVRDRTAEPPAITQAETTQPVLGTQGDIPVIATAPAPETLSPSTEATRETAARVLQTAAPLEGKALSEYAVDCLTYNETTRDWRTHDGVDLAAEAGAAVCAAAEGTVTQVQEDDALGYTVVVSHTGGYETLYACLGEDLLVAQGDRVTLGQQLGTVGQSALLETALGPHLHFGVRSQGKSMNPSDFLALGK